MEIRIPKGRKWLSVLVGHTWVCPKLQKEAPRYQKDIKITKEVRLEHFGSSTVN